MVVCLQGSQLRNLRQARLVIKAATWLCRKHGKYMEIPPKVCGKSQTNEHGLLDSACVLCGFDVSEIDESFETGL